MENSILISDAEFEALLTQDTAPQQPVSAPIPERGKARREQRWLVYNLRGNLYSRGRDYHVKVIDISLSGMGGEVAPKSLQKGVRCILVLDLDEYGTLATPVEIVYAQDGAYAQQFGIKFLPCEPEDIQPLEAYIDDIVTQAGATPP